MLSTTAEYALRAVVWLAAQKEAACTTEQISQATEVPGPYLSKVLQTLGRGGIVRSQRGLGGGFALAVSADQLTVLQVINAVDPMQRIKSCPLKLPAHGGALCPLHARLDAAVAMIEDVFGKCTIADLFDVPDAQTPLCASIRRKAEEDGPETPGGKG